MYNAYKFRENVCFSCFKIYFWLLKCKQKEKEKLWKFLFSCQLYESFRSEWWCQCKQKSSLYHYDASFSIFHLVCSSLVLIMGYACRVKPFIQHEGYSPRVCFLFFAFLMSWFFSCIVFSREHFIVLSPPLFFSFRFDTFFVRVRGEQRGKFVACIWDL